MRTTKILATQTLWRVNELQGRLAVLSMVCFMVMS